MRTLDRYILRSFLYSYLLCFLVMMGLRIVSDLFVNMDEFSELPIRGPQLVLYVVQYYAFNSLIYFQEMSGVILVAAAAFSLARMNHTNELVAVLASGVSLHRVVLPVALAAVLLASVGVVNREQLIPRVKDRLVRDRDDAPGESDYPVHLVVDDERNVWYSRTFRDRRDEQWMVAPLIICRDRQLRQTAKVAGLRATWRDGWWRVTDATVALLTRGGRRGGVSSSFIWTPRSPQVLAAGGKGTIGPADRIRIDYESLDRTADPQNPWLNRPRFEILAPPAIDAPPQTPPRVLATIAAVQAWYGPAAGGRGESGYHLLGPAELRDTDVRDYRPLAKALARWAREPDGSIEQRLWSLLPAAARADIEAIAAEPDAARNPARRQRIFGALAALVDGPLLARPADAGDGRFDLPPVDRTAVASGEASSAEQVRRINRLVLDGLAGPWLVGTQGILRMPTSLTPDDIRLRRDSAWMEYMSSREIGRLLREGQIPGFLQAAGAMNRRGWVLKVEDGYRNRTMQKYIGRIPWIFDAILRKSIWELEGRTPDPAFLFRRILTLTAQMPKIGTHMSGSAIDISVLDRMTGAEVDRGAPYCEMSERTPMDSPFVGSEAQRNRAAITEILEEAGFVAYPYEFWHYNSGDAYERILRNDREPAQYGAVDWDPDTGAVRPIEAPEKPLNGLDEIEADIRVALQRIGQAGAAG